MKNEEFELLKKKSYYIELSKKILNKSYIDELDKKYGLNVFDPTLYEYIDYIRAIKITDIIFDDKDEFYSNWNEVLKSFAFNEGLTLGVLYKKENGVLNIYLLVRENGADGIAKNSEAKKHIEKLVASIDSKFKGTSMEVIKPTSIKQVLGFESYNSVSMAYIDPSFKDDSLNFLNIIDQSYDDFAILILAESLSDNAKDAILSGYTDLKTGLSSYKEVGTSFGEGQSEGNTESWSESLSKSHFKSTSFSLGTNGSLSNSTANGSTNTAGTSTTNTTGETITDGVNASITEDVHISQSTSAGASIGNGMAGVSVNETVGVETGISSTQGISHSVAKSTSTALGIMESVATSVMQTVAKTIGMSLGMTQTFGSSTTNTSTHGTSVEHGIHEDTNRTYSTLDAEVAALSDRIDQIVEIINKIGSGNGLWKSSVYVLSNDESKSENICSQVMAHTLSDESYAQRKHLVTWNSKEHLIVPELLKYLEHLENPLFVSINKSEEVDMFFDSTSILSTNQLSRIFSIPEKSVNGISVRSIPRFGREVKLKSEKMIEDGINLGKVVHFNRIEENNYVSVPLELLRKHCFITGQTGSGKTNAVKTIIRQVIKNNVSVLVVDPKNTYVNYFPDFLSYGKITNGAKKEFKINIFKFLGEKNFDLSNYLADIEFLFRITFEQTKNTETLIPYLRDAFKQVVQDDNTPKTFSSVIEKFKYIMQGYVGEFANLGIYMYQQLQNIKTRNLITDDDDGLSVNDLFSGNSIIRLDDYGIDEVAKSFITAFIMIAQKTVFNSSSDKVRHICVLEEASRLIPNVTDEINKKTVDTIIGEGILQMREKGLGFIIVNQLSGNIREEAVLEPCLKVCFSTADIEAVKKSMNLTDEQANYIPTMNPLDAVVYCTEFKEPVICRFRWEE